MSRFDTLLCPLFIHGLPYIFLFHSLVITCCPDSHFPAFVLMAPSILANPLLFLVQVPLWLPHGTLVYLHTFPGPISSFLVALQSTLFPPGITAVPFWSSWLSCMSLFNASTWKRALHRPFSQSPWHPFCTASVLFFIIAALNQPSHLFPCEFLKPTLSN